MMECQHCNEATQEEMALLAEIEESFEVAGYEVEEVTVFKKAQKEA